METKRQYLYIDQLAELTPWSVEVIRSMISQGVFKLGVHYFKPAGRRRRPIFSWPAVVAFIEGQAQAEASTVPLVKGRTIDMTDALAKTNRLHH